MQQHKYNSLWFVVRKERLVIISSLLVGLLMGMVYYAFFYIPLYKTEIELFIRNVKNTSVVADFNSSTSLVDSESGYSNPLFNLKHLLESDKIANRTYEKLKGRYPESFEALGIKSVEDWKGKYHTLLSSSIKPSTDVISVNFAWPNKEEARPVLDIILKEFKGLNIEVRRYIEVRRRENLEKELENITSQIDDIHRNIADYETSNGAANLNEELSGLTQTRVSLEQQAKVARSRIAHYNNRVRELTKQLNLNNAQEALMATSIGRDPYLIELNEQLAAARQKHSTLLSKYTDKHPEVVAANNEINALTASINSRVRESVGSNPAIKARRAIYDEASQGVVAELANAQAELASVKAEYAALQQGIGEIKSKETRIPGLRKEWQRLQKTEPGLQEAYQSAQQKYMEAVIRERDVVDNIVPLGLPSPPQSSKKELIIKLIGFLAISGMVGLAIAWIKDGVEDQWVNAEEMELLTNRPVLGVLPWFSPDVFLMAQSAPNASVLELPFYHTALQISSHLRNNPDCRVLSLRGTGFSEQGNHITPHLAQALMEVGKRVAVVQTNTYNQPAPGYMGVYETFYDLGPILAEAQRFVSIKLNGRLQTHKAREQLKDFLHTRLEPILDSEDADRPLVFRFASPMDVNLHKILSSRAFAIFVDTLRDAFDVVLMDTPNSPISFPEVTSVLHLADASIVLAGFHHRRSQLTQVIHQLEEKYRTPVLGIIARQGQTEYHQFMEASLGSSSPSLLPANASSASRRLIGATEPAAAVASSASTSA